MIRSRRERLRITSLIVFKRSATVSGLSRHDFLRNPRRHDENQSFRSVLLRQTTRRNHTRRQAKHRRKQAATTAGAGACEELSSAEYVFPGNIVTFSSRAPRASDRCARRFAPAPAARPGQLGAPTKIVVVVQVFAVQRPHAAERVPGTNTRRCTCRTSRRSRTSADSPSENPADASTSHRRLNNPSTVAVNPLGVHRATQSRHILETSAVRATVSASSARTGYPKCASPEHPILPVELAHPVERHGIVDRRRAHAETKSRSPRWR